MNWDKARERERSMKAWLAILLCLPVGLSTLAHAGPSPAELISEFRLKQGEGRVVIDATLNRIALEQAKAMAARDKLDHDVLGSFNSRVAPAKAGRAAENIAYGYDSFEKTLAQWIDSAGHRKNLLLPKASRVGIASATSVTSRRTYWAMVIAGGYEPPPKAAAKGAAKETGKKETGKRAPVQTCRTRILGICF